MANTPMNLLAGGDIGTSRFVMLDTADEYECLEANANSKIIGISHESNNEAPIPSVSTYEAAVDGESIRIYGAGDICLLELAGTVAHGDYIISNADGKGVIVSPSAAGQNIGAIAAQSGVSGDKIRVQVHIDFAGAGSNS